MNKWLKRALVWNPTERVDFNISLAYFTKIVENKVNEDFAPPEQHRDARSKTFGGGFGPSIYPKENTTTPFDDPEIPKLTNNFARPFAKLVQTPFGHGQVKENYQTKIRF